MKKRDVQIGDYRVVSRDCITGQLYKNTGDDEIPCLLVAQWQVVESDILIEYDFPQDIDCIAIVKEALDSNEV